MPIEQILIAVDDATLIDSPGVVVYNKSSDTSYECAVTTAGPTTTKPLLSHSITQQLSGTVVTMTFECNIVSGTPNIKQIYDGAGFTQIDQDIVQGTNTVVITLGADYTAFNLYLRGSWLFDIEVTDVKVFTGEADPISYKTTWTDSVSAGIIGHKIYRDDVEIGDVGMGVEVYYDATAVIGETYKYEVQAYSATDETTTETAGVNVKSITVVAAPTNINVVEI